MVSTGLVQTNGLGSALWWLRQSSTARCSSRIERKAPRFSRLVVSWLKKPSTALAQDAGGGGEVQVKARVPLAKHDLAAGSNVVTDGLSCWTAVEQAGCSHFAMLTGSGPQAARWAPFTWVNTALGNIKTALAGTYHHVSAKHAQRYLTSYAWRFNRRYQLDTLTERLAYACARTAPHPYRVIIAG